jgi:hypothetical protein
MLAFVGVKGAGYGDGWFPLLSSPAFGVGLVSESLTVGVNRPK